VIDTRLHGWEEVLLLRKGAVMMGKGESVCVVVVFFFFFFLYFELFRNRKACMYLRRKWRRRLVIDYAQLRKF